MIDPCVKFCHSDALHDNNKSSEKQNPIKDFTHKELDFIDEYQKEKIKKLSHCCFYERGIQGSFKSQVVSFSPSIRKITFTTGYEQKQLEL